MKARDRWEKRTQAAEQNMFSDIATQMVALRDLYKLYLDSRRRHLLEETEELQNLAKKTLEDLEMGNPLLLGDTAEYRLARSHLHRYKYLFFGSEEDLMQAIREVTLVLEDPRTPHEEAVRAQFISNSLLRLKSKPLPHHTT